MVTLCLTVCELDLSGRSCLSRYVWLQHVSIKKGLWGLDWVFDFTDAPPLRETPARREARAKA